MSYTERFREAVDMQVAKRVGGLILTGLLSFHGGLTAETTYENPHADVACNIISLNPVNWIDCPVVDAGASVGVDLNQLLVNAG